MNWSGNFEGQLLKVAHDLDFAETLIITSSVTRPCWNGILNLCLTLRFWDHLPNVEKSHSKKLISHIMGHGVPDFEFGRKKLSPQVTTDSDTVFSRGIRWWRFQNRNRSRFWKNPPFRKKIGSFLAAIFKPTRHRTILYRKEARIITKRARELCFDFPFGRRGLRDSWFELFREIIALAHFWM